MRCPPLAAHGATAFAIVKTTTTLTMTRFRNSKLTLANVLKPLEFAMSGMGAPEVDGSIVSESASMLEANNCMTFTMKTSSPTIAA